MNKAQILTELQQWETLQKRLGEALDRLYDITGAQPDSMLLDAIYAVAGAHTEAIERIIGDDTKAMEWWAFECRFGENPLGAGKGGKLRPIKTLKQLAGLITTE